MAQRSKINLSTDELHNLSFDAFDEAINPRSDWHDFDAVVEDAISVSYTHLTLPTILLV